MRDRQWVEYRPDTVETACGLGRLPSTEGGVRGQTGQAAWHQDRGTASRNTKTYCKA